MDFILYEAQIEDSDIAIDVGKDTAADNSNEPEHLDNITDTWTRHQKYDVNELWSSSDISPFSPLQSSGLENFTSTTGQHRTPHDTLNIITRYNEFTSLLSDRSRIFNSDIIETTFPCIQDTKHSDDNIDIISISSEFDDEGEVILNPIQEQSIEKSLHASESARTIALSSSCFDVHDPSWHLRFMMFHNQYVPTPSAIIMKSVSRRSIWGLIRCTKAPREAPTTSLGRYLLSGTYEDSYPFRTIRNEIFLQEVVYCKGN